MNSKYNKEDLKRMILEEKLSYKEIGRRYGVSKEAIRGAARRFGIVSPYFSSSKELICLNCGKAFIPKIKDQKFCCQNCSSEYRSNEKYKNYLNNQESYINQENMRWVKKFILKEQNHKCAICGMEDNWNGKPIVFILDHIDGHAGNNCRDNLRLICPNCDSQLDTYKSKNKYSDRSNRKKYTKKNKNN